MTHGQPPRPAEPMTLERFSALMRRGACPPHRLREGGCATCAEHELAVIWATDLVAQLAATKKDLAEAHLTIDQALGGGMEALEQELDGLRAVIERTCAALEQQKYSMAEHAYDEIASALRDLPARAEEASE